MTQRYGACHVAQTWTLIQLDRARLALQLHRDLHMHSRPEGHAAQIKLRGATCVMPQSVASGVPEFQGVGLPPDARVRTIPEITHSLGQDGVDSTVVLVFLAFTFVWCFALLQASFVVLTLQGPACPLRAARCGPCEWPKLDLITSAKGAQPLTTIS